MTRVFIAGGPTMHGQALVRRLAGEDVEVVGAGADEPDPRDPDALDRFLAAARPDWIFLVAGRQAGIGGNQSFPADLMIDNLRVTSAVIPAAHRHGVKKLLYLASSCMYPKLAPAPFMPDAIWTGPLEPTSAAYAVAKLAGMTLADAYRRQHGAAFFTAIGADTFGSGDDFSADNSHVVGALIHRLHEARVASLPSVEIWGSGRPRREFIFVDDLADACIFAMRHYDGTAPLNLGTGVTTSIADLAEAVREAVGYRGELRFDTSRPDGMPVKGLDSSVLRALGWQPRWTLAAGLTETVRAFLAARESIGAKR